MAINQLQKEYFQIHCIIEEIKSFAYAKGFNNAKYLYKYDRKISDKLEQESEKLFNELRKVELEINKRKLQVEIEIKKDNEKTILKLHRIKRILEQEIEKL